MKLDAFLRERELTEDEFAELIGVSQQAVNRYRRGDRRPDWDVLQKIVKATDGAVQPNDFFNEIKDVGGPRHPEPVEAV